MPSSILLQSCSAADAAAFSSGKEQGDDALIRNCTRLRYVGYNNGFVVCHQRYLTVRESRKERLAGCRMMMMSKFLTDEVGIAHHIYA